MSASGSRWWIKPAELAQKLAPQDFLELMQGASDGIDEGQRTRMQGFVQAVKPMLRSVTVGQYATEQEQERDRRLLELIHDEADVLVADEEKKIGRPLTSTEYQSVMRRAADLALLHSVGLEGGDSDSEIPGALAWPAGLNDGSGMPPATSAGYNVAALDETDASSDSDPQAYPTNAAQADDPDSEDDDGDPDTLLAQNRGDGNRPRRPGGTLGSSGAPHLERILRRHEDIIRQLEPNNPKLSYIRDRNIPPSNEFMRSMELELEAAAFRFANKLSFGHGFRDHGREFERFGRIVTPGDYAAIAQRILTNPKTRVRDLGGGTYAYYSRSENAVVIVDPGTFDRGTMYRVPKGHRGERYFNELEKR